MKKWKTETIKKSDKHNLFDLNFELKIKLEELSRDGWEIHTILDNYPSGANLGNNILIVAHKDD